MPKRASGPLLTALSLDRDSAAPLHRQLYRGLREAILTKRLAPGERLPASRVLAVELGVSRNTVQEAFRQLWAEGYLDGKVGAGTYVAQTLPDDHLRAARRPETRGGARDPAPTEARLSRRGAAQAAYFADMDFPRLLESRRAGRAFVAGTPALDAFPFDLWGRLTARHARNLRPEQLEYQDAAGYPPLRAAIADYLRDARGVRCAPEQVILTAGAQQAMTLAAHLLLDPSEAAWVEDPGYFGVRGALLAAGARLVPVPVDGEGVDVTAGETLCPEARLACVTPAHQMPLGVAMSLTRRLALLEWARRSGAYILEDDYDGEYRYAGRPLASLQGLDRDGRVLYLGTFSKVLFPALRTGYLVVPEALVDNFRTARFFADFHGGLLEQAVLTDFLREGHFTRHIRRMRQLYAERQNVLLETARAELGGLLDVAPADTGMHLLGWLPPGCDDGDAFARAAAHGVSTVPLSRLLLNPGGDGKRGALMLGYAAVPPDEIRRGVRTLAAALTP